MSVACNLTSHTRISLLKASLTIKLVGHCGTHNGRWYTQRTLVHPRDLQARGSLWYTQQTLVKTTDVGTHIEPSSTSVIVLHTTDTDCGRMQILRRVQNLNLNLECGLCTELFNALTTLRVRHGRRATVTMDETIPLIDMCAVCLGRRVTVTMDRTISGNCALWRANAPQEGKSSAFGLF